MSHLRSPPSCPIPNTHTSVIENGDSNKAQFKLKIFSFINNSIVYLHCKLRICMETPGTTCKIVGVGCSKLLPGPSLLIMIRTPGVWVALGPDFWGEVLGPADVAPKWREMRFQQQRALG